MRRKKWTFTCTITIFLLLYSSALATGGTDLLVGPGTINADSPLTPGRSYTIPTHEIINNSFGALEMNVSVTERRDDERDLPPLEWFSIEPEKLIVQAKSAEEVQVKVNLPPTASPGRYKVWFLFDAMPIGGGGLVMAAAINVSLEFEVRDTGQAGVSPGSPEGPAGYTLGTRIPWALLIILFVAVSIGLTFILIRRQRQDRW